MRRFDDEARAARGRAGDDDARQPLLLANALIAEVGPTKAASSEPASRALISGPPAVNICVVSCVAPSLVWK